MFVGKLSLQRRSYIFIVMYTSLAGAAAAYTARTRIPVDPILSSRVPADLALRKSH